MDKAEREFAADHGLEGVSIEKLRAARIACTCVTSPSDPDWNGNITCRARKVNNAVRQPFTSIAEMFVRLSGRDAAGVEHEVLLPWDPEWNWYETFRVAHQNADGSYPNPRQCKNLGEWARCLELRKAEDELKRKCGR